MVNSRVKSCESFVCFSSSCLVRDESRSLTESSRFDFYHHSFIHFVLIVGEEKQVDY